MTLGVGSPGAGGPGGRGAGGRGGATSHGGVHDETRMMTATTPLARARAKAS